MQGFAGFIRCATDRKPLPRGTAKVHLRSQNLLESRVFALQQEPDILDREPLHLSPLRSINPIDGISMRGMAYMSATSDQNLEYPISVDLERNEVHKVETKEITGCSPVLARKLRGLGSRCLGSLQRVVRRAGGRLFFSS